MRNWIKHAVIALIMVSAGSPAFSFSDNESSGNISFGGCDVVKEVTLSSNYAAVMIRSDRNYVAGGSYFSGVRTAAPPITEAVIASCLGNGLTASDVALVANGATGRFADDDLMGFGFKLKVAAGGYQPNEYVEFKVGTGSLTPPPDFILSDSDALLEASPIAVSNVIPTTVDAVGEAVDLLSFDLSDGGSGDGTALSVTAIDVNVSGTGAASASKLTWLLNGPDATNVQGSFSGGKVTFSGLGVSVADGGNETYSVSAYFNDNTGLTEGQTLILSIDGDTDVTVASGSTTFGTTTPVTNGSGAAIDVVATRLVFTTQPAGSVSGAALSTQPVVTAQDAAGNRDVDFASAVVILTEASAGALSGTATVAAVSGVASFSGITYTATADQQDFALTAASGSLTSATSNIVTSDVVATKLVFATEPAPLSFNGNEPVSFTTVPVVHAVNNDGILDTGYVGPASLSEVNGAGTASFSGETTNFAAGVATFNGLGLTYSNSGVTTETFNLQAVSGSLTTANSAQLTARLAPAVLGVSSSTVDGSYKEGDTVSIQVTFSEAVDVTGTPALLLETGTTDRAATYASGSGGTVLTFTYTVQAGDTAADLDYAATTALSLNSGTIKSAANATDAVLTLPTPGQSGSLGAAKALVIDTTAPSGYTVAFGQGLINDGNKTAASFTFAGAEIGTSYSYAISSSGGGSAVTGTGTIATATDQITSLDVSGLGDGTLALSVTLTDGAGNSGSAATDTVSKDATAPSGQSVAFAQSVVNDSNKAAIGFIFANAEVGTSYSYAISSSGGGTNVTGSGTIATTTDQITGLDLSGLADGTLTLSVTLTDAANNAATAVTNTVTKDANAPAAPSAPLLSNASNSGSTSDTLTNDTTPTITGTAEANATVEVFVGATSAGTTPADGSGNWSFTFTEGALASGAHTITVTARDVAGNVSPASSALVITIDAGAPTVAITGPTDVVTEAFTATFTFSEAVTGFAAEDITVVNGTKGTFAGSGTTYSLVIIPELGTTVSVSVAASKAEDEAGNGNEASNTLEVSAGSPASEFAASEGQIRQVIVEDVQRALTSTLATNRRLSSEARTRFMTSQRQMDGAGSGIASRNNLSFDIDGTAEASGGTFSTKGSFYEQTGNYEGTSRRLFFGDFDVQHDTDTGSTTATLSGKLAWERMVSEQTMLGYFIGGELGRSQIDGTFNGDQNGLGVSIGGYFVSALQDDLFADGFVSLGMGRNDLTMGNGTLDLESDYATRTLTLGTALTGVIEREGYEIWPELAFTYGKTFIGDVDFTGRAYGLVDNALSLDAGDVSIANLTFRPEFRVPMDGLAVADSRSLFSFSPRAICEQVKTTVTTEGCGGGAELGIISRSEDGMTDVNARIMMDRIGDSTRSGLQFNFEHRF